jgi:hypothetical protein
MKLHQDLCNLLQKFFIGFDQEFIPGKFKTRGQLYKNFSYASFLPKLALPQSKSQVFVLALAYFKPKRL